MNQEAFCIESRDTAFRNQILKTPAGQKIPTCMQCGICSGSCPVSHEMDYTPRQLVRMVQLGLKKEVLSSNAIWICTTCFSCSVRCPRGIHPTELMETLKSMAMKEGITNRNVAFDNIFRDIVMRNGRASEFLLISRYSLKEPEMIKQLPFGLSMMKRGKLPVSTDRMTDTKELAAIFELEDDNTEEGKKA